MNSSIAIDRDNWAVTLISTDGSTPSFLGLTDQNFGHAQIVFEGVKEGSPFVKIVHLTQTKYTPTGYGIVKIKTLPFYEEIRYRKKTPTWGRPRVLVEKIEKEMGKYFVFDVTGNGFLSPNMFKNLKDAIVIGFQSGWNGESSKEICAKEKKFHERVSSEHNCLTWAKKGLDMMGVELPPVDSFIAAPNQYVDLIESQSYLVKFRS